MKGSNKSLFPETMSRDEIERTIRQAYRYGKRIETLKSDGDRILVHGNGIDIWIDKATKAITTAYPKMRN
ncbi:EndoU domain-containing protein [Endozoicomonas numazuensis]|nr:EndoU domain-containing protein [Endozoicomonas numazuensis]